MPLVKLQQVQATRTIPETPVSGAATCLDASSSSRRIARPTKFSRHRFRHPGLRQRYSRPCWLEVTGPIRSILIGLFLSPAFASRLNRTMGFGRLVVTITVGILVGCSLANTALSRAQESDDGNSPAGIVSTRIAQDAQPPQAREPQDSQVRRTARPPEAAR